MLAMRGRYVGHLIIYISEEEVISVEIDPDQKKRLLERMREEREKSQK